MIEFPPAKINLGLRVIKRRTDGYHDLFTVFYPIPLCDSLEILHSDKFQFYSYGISIPGRPEDNLVVKAWQVLHQLKKIPRVEIHLLKNIPMGAGLGGGSSDAALTLQMLNSMFELGLAPDELKEIALSLGSDCPFFLHSQPCAATGRGEELQPIELSLRGKYLLLVKPDIHISTAEAYKNVYPELRPHPAEILRQPIASWKEQLVNDFEPWALAAYPLLQQIKNELYSSGALYASMTGSGSAFYGIFEQEPQIPDPLKSHFIRVLRLTF
ncbi:MAG: 4-(cytidine 5'-diphospho)-2-C-methyl-D-erythritol kinase [Bacteroidales bacterium]|nr:4-(cytidine 5'-diphospho)-2-C-methyl-D-erythritol kinase [Bacteroidales bacterium]